MRDEPMKVFIDTNVLILAALSQDGVPFAAYVKASSKPNRAVICDQNIDEVQRVFQKKFPSKIAAVQEFFAYALKEIELVAVPSDEVASERLVRDSADRMILRAALRAGADVLLTGDKDLLDAGIMHPAVMTPREFLQY